MGIVGDVVKAKVIGSEVRKGIKEVKGVKEGHEGVVQGARTKCPQKPKVEVFWRYAGASLRCSYSGEKWCHKCIQKGKYPKK